MFTASGNVGFIAEYTKRWIDLEFLVSREKYLLLGLLVLLLCAEFVTNTLYYAKLSVINDRVFSPLTDKVHT